MPSENESLPDRSRTPASSEQRPEIEDAYAPETSSEEALGEDDPQLLDPASRSLESSVDHAESTEQTQSATPSDVAAKSVDKDDTSDTDTRVEEAKPHTGLVQEPTATDWANERSAHKIIVELKRVESEVRRLLENRDPKRKRKLAGTRRWLELEEDIASWRYSSRMDEPTLRRLQELVAKRHYLFKRLHFMAGTRPTWNT